MKTILTAAILIASGVYIGQNGSQTAFLFIIAGIVLAMYAARQAQTTK